MSDGMKGIFFLIGMVIIIVGPILFFSIRYEKKKAKMKEALKIGIKASAEILHFRHSGKSNLNALYKMRLLVRKQDGTEFEFPSLPGSEREFEIAPHNAHFLKKGATLPVRLHPEDPGILAFEFEGDDDE